MDLLIEIVVDFVFWVLIEIPVIGAALLALGLGVALYESWPLTSGQISVIVYGVCITVFCAAGLWLYRLRRHRSQES